jgi:hypothetical protein
MLTRIEAESRRAVRFMHPGYVPQLDGQAPNLMQINSALDIRSSPLAQPLQPAASWAEWSSGRGSSSN